MRPYNEEQIDALVRVVAQRMNPFAWPHMNEKECARLINGVGPVVRATVAVLLEREGAK